MESKREVPTFNSVAAEIGELVTSKNEAYGDSFAKCGEFLRLLYPCGLEPSKYGDALSMVRIFDKQMRIATRKDAFGESPYFDIAGYGLLGATADAKAAMFHTPLAPEEVQSINSSISPPSLCGTCIRQGCPVDCAEHTTECVNYLSRAEGDFVEPAWRNFDRSLPKRNDLPFNDNATTAPLSLALPSITVEGGLQAVYSKLKEELGEWIASENGSMEELIEAWDVIQVAQTYKERGGGELRRTLPCMEDYHSINPERTEAARRAMIIKNACRTRPGGGFGYYAPDVCERIILSGGEKW